MSTCTIGVVFVAVSCLALTSTSVCVDWVIFNSEEITIMSTQLTWAQCIQHTLESPLLVPDFYGGVGSNPHTAGREPCMYKEQPRRADRLPVRFGTGTPGVNTAATDLAGIPKSKSAAVIKASTPEGSLTLPVHFEEQAYLPSINALEILTHTTGTRRSAHPTRYYR